MSVSSLCCGVCIVASMLICPCARSCRNHVLSRRPPIGSNICCDSSRGYGRSNSVKLNCAIGAAFNPFFFEPLRGIARSRSCFLPSAVADVRGGAPASSNSDSWHRPWAPFSGAGARRALRAGRYPRRAVARARRSSRALRPAVDTYSEESCYKTRGASDVDRRSS